MARLKCRACGGEYDTDQPGGFLYFHVCPPLSRIRVTRGGVEQDVAADSVRPTDTVKVRRAGAVVDVLVSAVQPDDQRVGDSSIERPNRRDENVVVSGYDERGHPTVTIRSAGAGVDRV